MEFGKTLNPDIVNWDYLENKWQILPELTIENNSISSFKTLYIGGTSWIDHNWKGKWYPTKFNPNDALFYYSRQFNAIELNTTFYQIPPTSTIYKWLDKTPEDFKFCPKVFQGISRNIKNPDKNNIDNFLRMTEDFGSKLGTCFLQLPEKFDYNQREHLFQFLENIPKELPIAIEFRHRSWFSSVDSCGFSELKNYKKFTVITDVGGRRDVFHLNITGTKVVIRFVGNNLHSTDFSRLDKWIKIIQLLFSKGISQIYFFIHQPENIFTPQLAHYLGLNWKEKNKIDVRFPVKINSTEKQMTLF